MCPLNLPVMATDAVEELIAEARSYEGTAISSLIGVVVVAV